MNLYHAKMLPAKERMLVKEWEKYFDKIIVKLQNELEKDGIRMTAEDIMREMDKEEMKKEFAEICRKGIIDTIDLEKNIEDERNIDNE